LLHTEVHILLLNWLNTTQQKTQRWIFFVFFTTVTQANPMFSVSSIYKCDFKTDRRCWKDKGFILWISIFLLLFLLSTLFLSDLYSTKTYSGVHYMYRKFVFWCEKVTDISVNFALLCEKLPFSVSVISTGQHTVYRCAPETCRLVTTDGSDISVFIFLFCFSFFSVFGTPWVLIPSRWTAACGFSYKGLICVWKSLYSIVFCCIIWSVILLVNWLTYISTVEDIKLVPLNYRDTSNRFVHNQVIKIGLHYVLKSKECSVKMFKMRK